jgi:effector-binding domain-containing protein
MLVTAFLAATGGCQLHSRPVDANGDSPAAIAAPPLPFRVSNMRVHTVRGMTYLFSSTRSNYNDIMTSGASSALAALRQITAGGARPAGEILFIFHDPTEDPTVAFDLDIGVPVPDKTPAIGGFKVRKLPPFRCASMVYRGPLKHLRRAYDKLIPEMIAAGYVPSDELRESYTVWEGAESPNNVVEIQVGIR